MFAQWIRVLWSVLTNLLMCNTMFKWVWLEYFNTVQRRLPAHWMRRGRLMLSPTQFVSKKQLEPYPIGVFIAFMWPRNHFSFQHLALFLIYYLAPGGGCEVLFSPGLSVCVSVCDQRSKVKVTGTVHYFLKVQSYHKNWAIEKFPFFFFIDTS